MTSYSLGDVARICRISPRRLRYWERTQLVRPSLAVGDQPVFEFRDLVSVRSILGLLERGVPLRRIRESVEVLRLRLPELERPIGSLRFWEGERVLVRHQGALMELDGQLVLEFGHGAHAAAAPPPTRLAPRGAEGDPLDARGVALEWFEHGCRLDSDSATWAEAEEAYRLALEADPDFADAYCNLGALYLNQNRRDAAREAFEHALGLDPEHVEANLNLGAVHEEEGRDEWALTRYKAALAAAPLLPDAHVSLALLYEKLQLPRRALDHWRRYLQVDPCGAWAELARRRLRGT